MDSPITSEAQRREATRRLRQVLATLRRVADRAVRAQAAKVEDYERIAFHERQQREMREQRRTRNQKLFAHGSNAEVGGYLDLDQYAIRGLEANVALYALWMANAVLQTGASTRAEILKCIFADEKRFSYCFTEGLAISWQFAKEARDKETAEFLSRDAGDTRKRWRSKPVTSLQRYDIDLIELRLGIKAPARLRRGSAHDWIAQYGGHPDFWMAPERPPEWKLSE